MGKKDAKKLPVLNEVPALNPLSLAVRAALWWKYGWMGSY